MVWFAFMASITFTINSIFYSLFLHKFKRKINVEYLCDRGNAKDQFLSFIFGLECFKVGAERFRCHIVDCSGNIFADEYDRFSCVGFSRICKPNEVVKLSEKEREFI